MTSPMSSGAALLGELGAVTNTLSAMGASSLETPSRSLSLSIPITRMTLPYISDTSLARHLAPVNVWVTSTTMGMAIIFCILQGHETVANPSTTWSRILSS